MYSIAFPDMLTSSGRTKLYKDHEATYSNLYLILKTTCRQCLFGDPYYGTDLLEVIFMPNNLLVIELIQDEIYTAIEKYIPQLQLERKNITVTVSDMTVTAHIEAINRIDYTNDLYDIDLTDFSES